MDRFNALEASKQYRKSYIAVKDKIKNSIEVYFVDDIREDSDGAWHIIFLDCENNLFKRCFGDFEILEVPERTVFDHQGITYLFSKLPERQWSKGLTSSSCLIECFIKNSCVSFGEIVDIQSSFFKTGLSASLLQSLYSSKNLSFKEALDIIKQRTVLSCKINSKLYLSITNDNKLPYLLIRNNTPLAFYNDIDDVFYMYKEIYYQEVEDFVRREGINSRISSGDNNEAR